MKAEHTLGLRRGNRARVGERRWIRLQAALALTLSAYLAVAVGIGSRFKETGPIGPERKLTGNLIINTDFSPGLSPWQLYSGTAFSLRRNHGAAVARLEATAPVLYGMYEQGIALPNAREKYELSVRVRGTVFSAGKRIFILLIERAPKVVDTPDLRVAGTAARLSTRWRRLSVRGQVHRANDTLDAFVFVRQDIALGDAFYLKQVRLARVARAARFAKSRR